MPRTDLSWKTIRPVEGFYTSEIVSSGHKPVRTFLPSGYEPNYAYPLLVFFHGHGSNEEHILQLAPRLSRRNFICIGLRGQHMLRNRSDGRQHCTWEPDGQFDAVVEDYIFHAIEQTRATITSTPNGSIWPASARGRPWPTGSACRSPSVLPALSR